MAACHLFSVGDLVNIDGKGTAKVKKVKDGDLYEMEIIGTDCIIELPKYRLSLLKSTISDLDRPTTNKEQTTNQQRRFVPVDDRDIDMFVNKQANQNTLSKTFYDLKLLKQFFEKGSETREIYQIPPSELSSLLCEFFIRIRKQDGSHYEPSSIRGFMCSFDRQLRRFDYVFSIHGSVEFAKVREVVTAKQRELKREGKGNKPNRAQPITDSEIEVLWNKQQFGCFTPESVINTLWFFNTVHFGLRGSDEHWSMCWGDVNLASDWSGEEYLEFDERETKTRQGNNPRDVREVKPKMWVNTENPDRCPVQIYKFYKDKRPSGYSNPSNPFYIATQTKQTQFKFAYQWFRRQPIGVNKLTSIMKSMVIKAGLETEKKLSNHSALK